MDALGIIRICVLLLCFVLKVEYCHAREHGQSSLFAYEGYLTVPNAYVNDRLLTFHYGYLPEGLAPYYKEESDNWLFSSTLGFLPFVEMYLSVYVAPEVNSGASLPNNGAAKVRSPGLKVKVLQESETIPALAVGFFDPSMGGGRGESISSTFLVTTKQYYDERLSMSVGYGFDLYKQGYSRLKGVWGGCGYRLHKSLSIITDYDGEVWSVGCALRGKGFETSIASIDGHDIAYTFGYAFPLAK
jgi:hypothetical protein